MCQHVEPSNVVPIGFTLQHITSTSSLRHSTFANSFTFQCFSEHTKDTNIQILYQLAFCHNSKTQGGGLDLRLTWKGNICRREGQLLRCCDVMAKLLHFRWNGFGSQSMTAPSLSEFHEDTSSNSFPLRNCLLHALLCYKCLQKFSNIFCIDFNNFFGNL